MKDNLLQQTPKRTVAQLRRLQELPLEQKINLSLRRIEQFYNKTDGKVYISFSGGKDSTVLLHLVRSLYPDCKAVFADTGLEFPEIRSFVKTKENVECVKPEMHFKEVIKKYGFPVISKEVSQKVYEIRNTNSDKLRDKRLHGDSKGNGKLSKKWHFVVDAPFKCSDRCCHVMKKRPMKKIKNLYPIIGTMASESSLRKMKWLEKGCNSFTGKVQSTPISFWTEKDIWDYIKSRDIPYSKIYDMGYKRTGCVFCMFGLWTESKHNNRFTQLEKTHPALHKYCMEKLGLKDVIDWINHKLDGGQIDMFEEQQCKK